MIRTGSDPIPFSEITRREIKYLWFPHLPRGRISLLAADPGTGKTALALHLAASLSQSRPIAPQPPDPTPSPCHQVTLSPCHEPPAPSLTTDHCPPTTARPPTILLLSPEENPHDTLLPRLLAENANLKNIHHVPLPSKYSDISFADYLQGVINGFAAVDLIIIDPITAVFPLTPSSAQLQSLVDLAQSTNAAILLTTRLAKALPADPVDQLSLRRTIGSLSFAAAARSVSLLLPDPKDPARRLFIPLKSNLRQLPPPLAFRIQETVLWDEHPALDPLNPSAAPQDDAREDSLDPAIRFALDFLQKSLAEGPLLSKKITDTAKSLAIPTRALLAAKDHLHIDCLKQNWSGKWFWKLPDDPRPFPEDPIEKEIFNLNHDLDAVLATLSANSPPLPKTPTHSPKPPPRPRAKRKKA